MGWLINGVGHHEHNDIP